MADPYSPKVEINGGVYFPPPYSISTLDRELHHGMIAVGTLALLSVVSTFSLICFIAYRCINWKVHYHSNLCLNQYVVLVLNLLLADLQQSLGFMLSFHWIYVDSILAPSSACFGQAWLIHSGDVSSGFFVFAIALHTFYTAILGRRLSTRTFAIIVVGLWTLAFLLTGTGIGIHGEKYFVRAGAWCWVSSAFESDRLAFHYIWVFLIQFSLVLIYAVTFIQLRRKTSDLFDNTDGDSPNMHTIQAVNRITKLMTLYPLVYIVLTLPLSAGRMWSMSHNGASTSVTYSCIAGALMSSSGWVDTLLYTLTRKRLLRDTMPHTGSGRSESWGGSGGHRGGISHTRTVTIENGELKDMYPMTYPGVGYYGRKAEGKEVKKKPSRGEDEEGENGNGVDSVTALSRNGSADPIIYDNTAFKHETKITVGVKEFSGEDSDSSDGRVRRDFALGKR